MMYKVTGKPHEHPKANSGSTPLHMADSFIPSEVSFREGKKEALKQRKQVLEQEEALKALSKSGPTPKGRVSKPIATEHSTKKTQIVDSINAQLSELNVQSLKLSRDLDLLNEQIVQAKKDSNSKNKLFQFARSYTPEKIAAKKHLQELQASQRKLLREKETLDDSYRNLDLLGDKAEKAQSVQEQESISKKATLLFDEKREIAAERLLQFEGESGPGSLPPFVSVPLSDANKAFDTGNEITIRLINGNLRSEGVEVELSEDQTAIARLLGGNIESDLRKIEADKRELIQTIRELTDAHIQTQDALTELQILITKHPAVPSEGIAPEAYQQTRINLGKAEKTLLELLNDKNDNGIPKRIEHLQKALNLATRMERTTIIQSAIEGKRIIQAEINKKANHLSQINNFLETHDGDPSTEAAKELGFSDKATRQQLIDKTKILTLELDGGKTNDGGHVCGLKNDARSADQIFEQELIKLQDQDADPKLGLLPLDNWTPWLIDIFRDATGLYQQSIRKGQERVNVLVREKLLADNGVTMSEAYEELGKSLQGMLSFDPKKRATEFAKLLALPRWVYENPALLRELVRNFQLTISLLTADSNLGDFSRIAQSIKDVILTDAWVQDFIEGSHAVENKNMSAAGLALLDFSNFAPILVAANSTTNSYLGNFAKQLGIPGGGFAGNAITGALKGILTATFAKAAVKALPTGGRFLQALLSLQSGVTLQEASFSIAKRGIWAEIMSFGRSLKDRGAMKTLVDIAKNFKSWWIHSSKKEIAWRLVTQVGPIAVGIALSATGAGAVVGIPLILGTLAGAAAVSMFMRFLNEHALFRDTTEKVNKDAYERLRDERRLGPESYTQFLQKALVDYQVTRNFVEEAKPETIATPVASQETRRSESKSELEKQYRDLEAASKETQWLGMAYTKNAKEAQARRQAIIDQLIIENSFDDIESLELLQIIKKKLDDQLHDYQEAEIDIMDTSGYGPQIKTTQEKLAKIAERIRQLSTKPA